MFSVKELVEIAVNVEENGEKFYRKLSKKVENDEQKKLFEYLAGQEIEHARVFRKLGYVEGKVFPSFNTMFERVKGMSFESIIDCAIQLEKDTILFYNEVLKLIKNERSRKMIASIIEQEKRHVLDLIELKESVQ